ncbi:cell division protein [Streptococcus dysgalactiae subsp. dysgalactiae ATCC 27957]|nr:cell division protein [Streptococcus dysgalactiae subsp. dysgalactiae ATCC 27957]
MLNIDANEKREDILKEAELTYRKDARKENSNIININQFQ